MSVFEFENIRAVTGGEWLVTREPPHSNPSPTGTAAAEPLDGVAIDTREDLTNRVFVAIKGDRHDGHSFLDEAVKRGARLLIVDREVMGTATLRVVSHPPRRMEGRGTQGASAPLVLRVADTRRALAQLAQAYRRTLTDASIIAITGSCGKTTTKRLVHGALSTRMKGSSAPKSFNNDIGVPLTILNARPDDQYVVVEVGTNAPGEIAALAQIVEPDIAVITSIGRSHLEGLGSVAGVAKEKSALIAHRKPGGVAIATADSVELREHLPPDATMFGEADDAHMRLTARGRDHRGWWHEINGSDRYHLALPGKHNALNAIAAIAVAQHMGLSHDEIEEGLLGVHPEAMRLCPQRVAGIDIFNDAYNANPESVAAALETFAEMAADAPRRVVILSDMLELGESAPQLHVEIAQRIIDIDHRVSIDQVILIGELAAFTARALALAGLSERIMFVDELSVDTMPAVLSRLAPGDSVLIKGSRGTAMERIIDGLETRAETSTRPHVHTSKDVRIESTPVGTTLSPEADQRDHLKTS